MRYISQLLFSGLINFFSTPDEAGDFLRSLQLLLQLVGASDGRMDQVSHLHLYFL